MRPATGTPVYRPDLGFTMHEYYDDGAMGMIGTQIMPITRVPTKTGTYKVIPAEALMKMPETKRAPGGAYNRSDFEYERGKYDCYEHGHEEPIDDDEREQFDHENPGGSDEIAMMRAQKIIGMSQEKRIADKVFNASNFTAHAVTNEWDDASNATPITDIKTGTAAFRLQCGMLPNALIIAWSTFEDLKNCSQIVDRIKYTFPGIDINKMTSTQLAACLGVPQVLVGGTVYDSANKGQSKNVTDVWNHEYAALVRIATTRDPREPCLGRTYVWDADSSDKPIVEVYREDQIRSDVYRVRHTVDERLTQSFNDSGTVVSNIAAACCYLFSNITT